MLTNTKKDQAVDTMGGRQVFRRFKRCGVCLRPTFAEVIAGREVPPDPRGPAGLRAVHIFDPEEYGEGFAGWFYACYRCHQDGPAENYARRHWRDVWPEEEGHRHELTARRVMSEHDCKYHNGTREDKKLARENCGACMVAKVPAGGVPNYAGWARIWVEAGREIPRALFRREVLANDNAAYLAALRRSLRSFGWWPWHVQFIDARLQVLGGGK